jgi:hypothetical protein
MDTVDRCLLEGRISVKDIEFVVLLLARHGKIVVEYPWDALAKMKAFGAINS